MDRYVLKAESEAAEAELLQYLKELADGTRWIYTESHRIQEAAQRAYDLIVLKNQREAVNRAIYWKSISERGDSLK